jgi:hypothetical protein
MSSDADFNAQNAPNAIVETFRYDPKLIRMTKPPH